MRIEVLSKAAKALPRRLPLINRLPKEFKKLLPVLYFFTLFLGFLLIFVYAFVPSFVTCSSFFGEEFCTPTGIFIALSASIPGYIIAGNILFFVNDLPWVYSLITVILVSGIFYYIIGALLDRLRGRKLNTETVSKIIIITLFFVLVLLLLSLLINQKG